MTVALNIILMAVVFSAVVGTLAWTIVSYLPRPGERYLTRSYFSPACGEK